MRDNARWRSCGDELRIDESIKVQDNGVGGGGLNDETVDTFTEANRGRGCLDRKSSDLLPAE